MAYWPAGALLQALWQSRRGCLSVQVLQEFYVTVTQKVAAPYNAAEAAGIIEDMSAWRVHSPAAADVLSAIEIQTRRQLLFWHAMIVQSANPLGCKVLWTEGLSHGQMINQTTIQNPFR